METVKSTKIAHLVLIAIPVHVVLLIAILDIHFKSSIENGMTPIRSTDDPPAKRLVMIIADGLRAQAIFDHKENVTSYLTSIRNTRGVWGVSHTRVPTESRPAHVAILAGIYEDPSAIFKSWKKFPIDFDTVFNESSHSWLFGTEEITSIFNKSQRNHIESMSSPHELIDYKRGNHTELDEWVFKKISLLLKNSGGNSVLQESRIIFSLHLSGLDMTGHSKKPYTEEYDNHIRYMDSKIKKIVYLVEKTFKDNLTAFIFTSDHGMTDWGSHGAGSDEETLTPFVAWGAGIKANKERVDIQQIDIAPFISSLLGINFPVNSLGKVPVQYFKLPRKKTLDMFLNNLKQIFKVLEVKQNRIVRNKLLFLHGRALITPKSFNQTLNDISGKFLNSSSDEVFEACRSFFDQIVAQIDYFDNYYRTPLIGCIALGFLLWITYVFTYFVSDIAIPKLEKKEERIQRTTFLILSFMLILLCFSQSFSLPYYLYVLFPNVMFHLLLTERKKIAHLWGVVRKISLLQCIEISLTGIFVIFAVLSFYYRFCVSIVMILVSCSPLLSRDSFDTSRILSWLVLSLILSIFPLLPVMISKFHVIEFVVGYVSWQYLNFCFFVKKLYKLRNATNITTTQRVILMLQNICFNISCVLVLSCEYENNDNSSAVKVIAWLSFLIPIILIPFSMAERNSRLLTIFSAFLPFYLLTSMSYELIFISFFTIHLFLWMNMEKKDAMEDANIFENLRKSLIFVALILVGYFGPGNIPSISSYNPMWLRFLLTSFSPFCITALILLKLTLPFLFASCVFRNIVLIRKLNLTQCFCMILIISDLMVFHFMFNVKNVGSWLEIGLSVSYFVVVECFTIGVLCLYFVAYVLTNVEIPM